MTADQKLLQECLDVFKKIRHWTDPDYYREHIMPTVDRLRDHLALVDVQKFGTGSKHAGIFAEPKTVPMSLLDNVKFPKS